MIRTVTLLLALGESRKDKSCSGAVEKKLVLEGREVKLQKICIGSCVKDIVLSQFLLLFSIDVLSWNSSFKKSIIVTI